MAAIIEPGTYPISISVAGDEAGSWIPSVAAVRVLVSAEPVVAWNPAWEHAEVDNAVEALGFNADIGQMCLLYEVALPFLESLCGDESAFDEITERAMREHWAVAADPESGLNVSIVSCGMGDGTYPPWVGIAGDCGVSQIVVDLELLADCQPLPGD